MTHSPLSGASDTIKPQSQAGALTVSLVKVQGTVYFMPRKAEQSLFFRSSEIRMSLEGSDVSESMSGSEIFIFI